MFPSSPGTFFLAPSHFHLLLTFIGPCLLLHKNIEPQMKMPTLSCHPIHPCLCPPSPKTPLPEPGLSSPWPSSATSLKQFSLSFLFKYPQVAFILKNNILPLTLPFLPLSHIFLLSLLLFTAQVLAITAHLLCSFLIPHPSQLTAV